MKITNNICTIGDSHTGVMYTYSQLSLLGPVTMYSLTTNKLHDYINYLLNNNEINYDSWWLFICGEIDIRCLFYKQIYTKNRNEDEVITTLVDNYIDNICSIDHKLIILSTTTPPAKVDGNTNKFETTINSKYPFIGSDEDRCRWAKKLNEYILSRSSDYNIKVLDIYNTFKNKHGFLEETIADADNVHVKYNQAIYPVIQKLFN